MTSRRRVSTFSFSPNSENGHGGVLVDGKSALERKLELLEARFTMPLDQQQTMLQAQNHPHLHGSSNNSSPDTLGEDSSPASVAQTNPIMNNNNNHVNNNNSLSQQSFGFDTPSLSYSNQSRQRPVIHPPAALVLAASKTPSDDPIQPPASSRDGWKDVAVAHMAKVAALQHVEAEEEDDDDDDEHTLVTSHVRPPVCVQESPPFMPPKLISTTTANTDDRTHSASMVRRWNFCVLKIAWN